MSVSVLNDKWLVNLLENATLFTQTIVTKTALVFQQTRLVWLKIILQCEKDAAEGRLS